MQLKRWIVLSSVLFVWACGSDTVVPSGPSADVALDALSDVAEDTTQPEDTAPPEDTATPEDTAPPEDTATPEDTAPPEDTAQPEDTAPPEDAVAASWCESACAGMWAGCPEGFDEGIESCVDGCNTNGIDTCVDEWAAVTACIPADSEWVCDDTYGILPADGSCVAEFEAMTACDILEEDPCDPNPCEDGLSCIPSDADDMSYTCVNWCEMTCASKAEACAEQGISKEDLTKDCLYYCDASDADGGPCAEEFAAFKSCYPADGEWSCTELKSTPSDCQAEDEAYHTCWPTPCEDYCATMAAHCSDKNTPDFGENFCLLACWGFPQDEDAEAMSGNSLQCRLNHAKLAGELDENGESTAAIHCPHASPDGGGVCVEPAPDPCEPNPCLNAGTCAADAEGNTTCKCIDDYTGDTCEVAPVDPCDPNPCLNAGTCAADAEGNTTCKCIDDYTGDTCEVAPVDPCDPNPCLNAGECKADADGNTTCSCLENYSGDLCETCSPTCEPGTCGGDGCGSPCACGDALVCDAGVCVEAGQLGDSCKNPYIIDPDELPWQTTDDTSNYTDAHPMCGGQQKFQDVVYSFTPKVTGKYGFSMPDYEEFQKASIVSISSSGVCGNSDDCLIYDYYDNGGDPVSIEFEAGTTYYLIVDSYTVEEVGSFTLMIDTPCVGQCPADGSCGQGDGCGTPCGCADGDICLENTCTAPLAGNTCENALMVALDPNNPVVLKVDTTVSTNNYEATEMDVCPSPIDDENNNGMLDWSLGEDSPDQAVMLNAPGSGTVTATITLSSFDTSLYAVTDCKDVHGTCVAGADGFGEGGESITFAVQAGQMVYLIVDGFEGESGTVDLTLTFEAGPIPPSKLCEDTKGVWSIESKSCECPAETKWDAEQGCVAPVKDACLNAADSTVLDATEADTLNQALNDCAMNSGAGGSASIGACFAGKVGISEECAGCYGELAMCFVQQCFSDCQGPGSSEEACAQCNQANCLPDFAYCSGDGAGDEGGPEALCLATDGNWMADSCGDWKCGEMPMCEAIIPGCNCGEGKSFDAENGCFTDETCKGEPEPEPTVWKVETVGSAFKPNELNIAVGDSVAFTVFGIHNAVQVSQSTWEKGGKEPLEGGFFVVADEPQEVVFNKPGTYYYLCQPHSTFMKGTIVVK